MSDSNSVAAEGGTLADGMQIRTDPYRTEHLAPSGRHLPADAIAVAAAEVEDSGVVSYTESYFLSPAAEVSDRYDLWASIKLLNDQIVWIAARGTGKSVSDAVAAEALLGALWKSRGGPVALVKFVENIGFLPEEALGRVSRAASGLDIPPDLVAVDDQGVGTLRSADGKLKYRGDLRDGVPQGRGTAFRESGAVWYEGDFQKGKPHGQVKIYRRDGVLCYEGTCEDGYPYGRGTEYHKNGKVWFDGHFGRQSPSRIGYGARNYVSGRLFRESGELVHDGEFEPVGNGHSRPKRAAEAAKASKEHSGTVTNQKEELA